MKYAAVMRTLTRRYRSPAASERATPWECLLFTALTARSRDEQVEGPFRELMRRYPDPKSLAAASVAEVGRIIGGIGLHRSKARNAVAMAKVLMRDHGGRVPRELDALVALPGVGRKTASCVLVYSFGTLAIPVDTHVQRIVNRLGWVKAATPEATERALRATLPRAHWLALNRVMVQFGREICQPRVPRCKTCPVAALCAYPHKTSAS
jgi:endonuclease III